MGDRLLAEYQPQSNKLYYYTTDHINSVRVVTDQNGNGVYAAAYDPYGGIQKIWENSYSPALKFSGKERDEESGLDYFGARYYANFHYRWLSPDPMINREDALRTPQLWNLYSFCRNNPVTYWDPTGNVEVLFTKFNIYFENSQTIRELSNKYSEGLAMTSGGFVLADIHIDPVVEKREKGWGINVKMRIGFDVYVPKEGDIIYKMGGKTGLPGSVEESLRHELGHVVIDLFYISKLYSEALLIESIDFPLKFLAQTAGYCFLGNANITMYGPRIVSQIGYDFFKIKIF
ncbi:MAG: hypothetical protein H5U06_00755 [Candidatus Aminicenantes bacterium]|nr:hypothetical protein [Candidatus Aminicenantes bacterium]